MDIHPHEVSLSDDHVLLAIGCGLIYGMQLLDDGTFINVALKDVLYVPGLMKNLVSMAVITDAGYEVVIMQHHCTVQHPHTHSVCLVTTCSGQMLCVQINFKTLMHHVNTISSLSPTLDQLHQCYGHPSKK
jgi:hypothetical protein